MKTIRPCFSNFSSTLPIMIFSMLLVGVFENRILLFFGLDSKVFGSVLFILVWLFFTIPSYFFYWYTLPKRYKSHQFRLKPMQYYNEKKEENKKVIFAYRILGGLLIIMLLGIKITGIKGLFPIFFGLLVLFLIISFSFGIIGSSRLISEKDQVSEIWITPEKVGFHLLEGKIYEFENSEIQGIDQDGTVLNVEYFESGEIKSQRFSIEYFAAGELTPLFNSIAVL